VQEAKEEHLLANAKVDVHSTLIPPSTTSIHAFNSSHPHQSTNFLSWTAVNKLRLNGVLNRAFQIIGHILNVHLGFLNLITDRLTLLRHVVGDDSGDLDDTD